MTKLSLSDALAEFEAAKISDGGLTQAKVKFIAGRIDPGDGAGKTTLLWFGGFVSGNTADIVNQFTTGNEDISKSIMNWSLDMVGFYIRG